MTKEDMRDIFGYLGLSIRRFSIYLLLNFIILLSILILLAVIFVVDFRFLSRPVNLVLVLLAALAGYALARNTIMRSQKWMLGLGFFAFMRETGSGRASLQVGNMPGSTVITGSLRESLKSVKSALKKSGLKWVSTDLAAALSAWSVDEPDLNPEALPDFGRFYRQVANRYFLGRILVFTLCLIPFALLSLLLTIGTHTGLVHLVFAMGFLFAFFLYAAVFEPIFWFFICRRIHSISTSRGT